MDLTFQDPMQYCSLQHWTLLLSPVQDLEERPQGGHPRGGWILGPGVISVLGARFKIAPPPRASHRQKACYLVFHF